jgi:hypothetical protein
MAATRLIDLAPKIWLQGNVGPYGPYVSVTRGCVKNDRGVMKPYTIGVNLKVFTWDLLKLRFVAIAEKIAMIQEKQGTWTEQLTART